MTAYYNEIDPFAAAWLRELIKAGHIAPGEVDTRSIEDVLPTELVGFTQCHFFAGIGGWSLALRQAGWPDSRPIWTGSCPCQPFSAAGKGAGFADERHLWPAFFHLIKECRPVSVFGEQVASKDTNPWFDLVQADLESMGYAFGCVPFAAAGVGAPHPRERAYWVADSEHSIRRPVNVDREDGRNGKDGGRTKTYGEPGTCGEILRLADTSNKGLEEQQRIRRTLRKPTFGDEGQTIIGGGSSDVRLADNKGERRGETGECGGRPKERAGDGCEYGRLADTRHQMPSRRECEFLNSQSGKRETTRDYPHCEDVAGASTTGPTNGHWRDADWLFCRDEKWRPVRPGTFPLASGVSNRVGRLRGYGNSIVVPQAEEVIRAFIMETERRKR